MRDIAFIMIWGSDPCRFC